MIQNNVLIITNRFIYGGIENLLLNFFYHKKNNNIHYDVLALTAEHDEELIRQLKEMNIGYYTFNLDKYKCKPIKLFLESNKLYNFLKSHDYQVMHINMTSFSKSLDLFIAKKLGIEKRIMHVHTSYVNVPIFLKLRKPFGKLYDFTATDFLACSDEAAKFFYSNYIYNNKKYIVINNGIDTSKFQFSEKNRKTIRHSLNIPNDYFVIGNVGRLTKDKNQKFLIEIFFEFLKLNPKSILMIVGNGELKKELEEFTNKKQLSKNVIFYGSSSEIGEILSAFDVFVFPSIHEGLGISLIEAQTNGLPCYASDTIPDLAFINPNVYKLSIDSGAETWANMIFNNTNDRFNDNGKITASGFSIENTVNQLENIYLK